MNVFGQAGLLMLYGLSAVFGALLLFYAVIALLTRIFPPKEEAKAEE